MKAIAVLLALLSVCGAVASENQWQLYKERHNVRVEYSKASGNLLQIRATTTIKSGIGAFLYLLEDTDRITDWLANSQGAEVLAQPDQYTHIVHTRFKAIWPVSPRDTMTHSVWSQHPNTLVLTILVTDVGAQYPPEQGYIRMQQVEGEWTLTPLAQGGLLISYQGQADPAGNLPHFIGNNVALKSTLQSFLNLSKVLPDYQKQYPNIIER